jgi:hypothetical protein
VVKSLNWERATAKGIAQSAKGVGHQGVSGKYEKEKRRYPQIKKIKRIIASVHWTLQNLRQSAESVDFGLCVFWILDIVVLILFRISDFVLRISVSLGSGLNMIRKIMI